MHASNREESKLYDFFIWSLTVIGILGIAVFSYKMAHSRGYPIGIVRRRDVSQSIDASEGILVPGPFLDELYQATTPNLQKEILSLIGKGCRNVEIAQALHVSEHTVRRLVFRYSQSQSKLTKAVYQPRHEEYYPQVTFNFDSVLQELPAEKDPTLEKKVEDLEKRIRRLEVQSVLKSQESNDRPNVRESKSVH